MAVHAEEFVHLLIKDAFSISGLFVGWPSNVIPIHIVQAVAGNKYYIVGKMISTILVQGGQPSVCFSSAITNYLVYDEVRSNACFLDHSVRQTLVNYFAAIVAGGDSHTLS